MTLARQLRRTACFAAAALFFVLSAVPAAAQTPVTDAAGFTVQAVIPDNQIDKDKTYFDLAMEPGMSQILQVAVANNSDQEMIVDVSLHSATTNRNGIIEYQSTDEPDESMRFPFHTISSADSEIRLPAGHKKLVEISVKMPQQAFDGTVLGGIAFTKRPEEVRAAGTGINNQFSYVIGVKLSESGEVVQPDFNLKSVEETLINYRAAVVANIQNPQPLIIQNADTSAQVYKAGAAQPLFSVSKESVNIAPNSVFPLPVEWRGEQMEPGDYRIAVKLTHDDKEWIWDENFSISKDGAQTINDNSLVPMAAAPGRGRWWVWVLVLIGILLLLLLVFYLGRKSKRDQATS